MTNITVKFTPRELEILCSLATDQLFRREFIDPSFPGHKSNAADLGMGKQIVERLRAVSHAAKGSSMINRTAAAVERR